MQPESTHSSSRSLHEISVLELDSLNLKGSRARWHRSIPQGIVIRQFHKNCHPEGPVLPEGFSPSRVDLQKQIPHANSTVRLQGRKDVTSPFWEITSERQSEQINVRYVLTLLQI